MATGPHSTLAPADRVEPFRPARRGLFAAFAALPLVAATSGPAIPDVELIRLGVDLERAWIAERAAWEASEGEDDDDGPRTVLAQEANERTSDIVGRIEAISATTLRGLVVKIRAVAWCRSGDPVDAEALGACTTDMRLVVGILGDLSRLDTGA